MCSLPAQLSSFVGREREILRVRDLLQRTRLVTLTGTGGAGKTRLALQVADSLGGEFTHGVWLVELAALSDPALVAAQTASALGLEERPPRTALESVLEYIDRRSLLLVVDNCEHLIDACAALCERILRGCANVRIMATSRQPLGVPGEVTWRVPSLTLSSDTDTESEAVSLFVERAREASPDFALIDDNASAVAQICRRLDGMPLAIELAAALVRVLAPQEIAERLDDRFGLLTQGARTALPRQQTLRATVDWSYALLSAPQQLLFRALAVFAGGWTLDAAEAVGIGGATLSVLTQLIERSLVVVEAGTRQMRYTLLETLRQYAAEELAEHGEEDAARARHLAWCVALAEQAASSLRGTEQAKWLDRLEVEHDNLRAALRWAEQRGSELQVRLSNALWEFWYIRGYLAEGQAWLDAGARRTDVSLPLRARALKAAGSLAAYRYNFDRAAELDREAIAVARALDDRALLAACVMNLANAEHDLGLHDAADAHYAEARELMNELGDRYGVALTLLNQADVKRLRGEHARATDSLEEALPLFRDAGDARRAARTEMNLGLIAFELRDHARAKALTRHALVAFRDLGFKPGVADCLELLAGVAAAQGDAPRAARLFGAYEALQERVARTVSPEDEARREASLQRIRTALGAREMQREREAGRLLPFDDALRLAIGATSESVAAPPRLGRLRLTAREHEVALLLAQGLTNRQIAERLVLSERTADAHVRNIFDKLGVNSRAQVAVWAVTERRPER